MVHDNEIFVDLIDGIEVNDDLVEISTKDESNVAILVEKLYSYRYVTFEYKNLHICYDTEKGVELKIKGNVIQFRLQ